MMEQYPELTADEEDLIIWSAASIYSAGADTVHIYTVSLDCMGFVSRILSVVHLLHDNILPRHDVKPNGSKSCASRD